ncbi:MAG: lysoplasmalogenase [Chloroflexi bacterium]|nr:lysoplasmalogenase [Chloroflexota bacterium]
MFAWLPIPFLVVCVLLLLRAETAQPRDVVRVRLWKPAATAMAIAASLLSLTQGRSPVYAMLVTIGLVFCLIGDVYLIDGERPEMFMRGLFAFLLGHMVFIAAFTVVQQATGAALDFERELASAAVLAVLVTLFFLYMRDGMGALRGPVLVYMAVIALMVHRAVGGAELGRSFPSQSALAVGGAMLFMISDVILALNRFVFPADPSDGGDRVWVLSTYYGAIALIALSCAY